MTGSCESEHSYGFLRNFHTDLQAMYPTELVSRLYKEHKGTHG